MRTDVLRTGLAATAMFTFMLALNHWMPIHRDDYDYAMVWKTGAHLASLSDVAASGVQHYLLHGGRTVTVFCLQLFLWLGKTAFDIANALMFLALVVLVTMHARRTLTFWHAPGLFAAAGLLLWLSLPHFGEVAVWKSGSTVYLWSAVPAFLGITEPAIFGINLRFMRPFICGLVGGACAGAVAGFLHLAGTGMGITVLPGTLLYLDHLPAYILVNVIGFAVAFGLTFVVFRPEE